MPSEDRRIIFEFQETYKALYALSMQKDLLKPPPGIVRSVALHDADPARVIVRIENPQTNLAQNVEFTRDFLAGALMLYCRTLRIPLPKSAQKSVEFTGESVVLRVRI